MDIAEEAFDRYLPVVGSLAAGPLYHGFEIDNLDAARECPWIEVPPGTAKRGRYVVEVAGDSMEPTLQIGDLVVFEYHRRPRADNQIVVANVLEFGDDSSGFDTEAIKRLTQRDGNWIFRSDNDAYTDIVVSMSGCDYPILGIMVAKLT